VFDFLSGQLQTELDGLAGIVSREVPAFNELLGEKGLQPIDC
jgi:hypothetical protein